MLRLKLRLLLVLLPLLFVWIMYQVSYFINIQLTAGHKLTLQRFNSTDGTHVLKYTLANKLSWLPPDVFDKNYDDDFHEFLEPVKKTPKKRPLKHLWFMKNGDLRPEQLKVNVEHQLWPDQNGGDRIVEQLMYSPENYSNEWSVPSPLAKFQLYDYHRSNLKKILLIGDFARNQIPPGRSMFWQDRCPVNTCAFVSSIEEARHADALIFKNNYLKGIDSLIQRMPHHVWVLYLLEPSVGQLGDLRHVINWTASYRHDSDIVTPYGKFVPYKTASLYAGAEKIKVKKQTRHKNFAAGKWKKVAWFSDGNCDSKDDRLSQYAANLSRYVELDVFGSCGEKKCPGGIHSKCLKMLEKDYKFYLAFEKNNCREYITDVFFVNGLGHNILPIVMGPGREDYARIAPPHSFIHVNDFATPEELADYLNILDTNDNLYNEYFNWKGTGELVNTYFWCRLCALLHAPLEPKSYEDIQQWWSGPGVCEA